jgi:glycosyltransferase involved in cell wall biosynthesis
VKFALVVTNLAGGGAEKALLKVGEGLGKRGHEVHFVLLESRADYLPPAMCRMHVVTPGGQRAGHGFFGKRVAAWRLKRTIRRLSHNKAFDLIVSTLPFADEVALRARLPAHWCRIANTLSAEIDALARRDPAKAARRKLRYQRYYGSARLIAVSDGVADDLRASLGLADARVARIYNPFDFSAIEEQARQAVDTPPSPYLLHIGRFAPQKRHDLLFAAYQAAGLSQQLVLLTPPDPTLDALIAAHGLQGRVVVAGFQANPYPWIAGADLLVLCSDHEGLPNVLIEALACGTRVVSTDCPSGPREILTGSLAKHLVPCDDPGALTEAIQLALAAPAPTVEAKKALLPFSAESVLDAYEHLARPD